MILKHSAEMEHYDIESAVRFLNRKNINYCYDLDGSSDIVLIGPLKFFRASTGAAIHTT